MPQYLLRVEGVNFDTVIFDTDDISTRRGGSLMVLNAPMQLNKTVHESVRNRLKKVATGSSFGLFLFDAKDDKDAELVRETVDLHFRRQSLEHEESVHVELKYATFVVDFVPVDRKPNQAVQKAIAANRWRQMQSPTLSLEGIWDEESKPCKLSFVRPGVIPEPNPDKKADEKFVSYSVDERRRYGRKARQLFYSRETGEPIDDRFVNDFGTLTKADGLNSDEAPPSSRDKLAVFYVDGNKFGEHGRTILNETEGRAFGTYEKWSEAIREHHRSLLKALVHRASNERSWQSDRKDQVEIRLETLIWGGDEILWIVPAWKGWELAEWFFSETHSVTYDCEPIDLTYGCGLVFCHVKAPIQNVIALASDLADKAKAATNSARHGLAYEVLESYDSIHGDLDIHRSRWLPKDMDPNVLVLNPSLGKDFWNALRAIAACDDFPMRQLYQLNKAWRKQEADLESYKDRLAASAVKKELEQFRACFDNDAAWLHLLQMLPYTPTAGFPTSSTNSDGNTES